MPALDSIGGIRQVVEITSPDVIVQPVSPSFQARDIFCPATAHLAAGMAVEELVEKLDPDTLIGLTAPEPETEPGTIRCQVLEYNRFGNAKLNVRRGHLEPRGSGRPASSRSRACRALHSRGMGRPTATSSPASMAS
jgi:S-adenosylmethionine hydrolase